MNHNHTLSPRERSVLECIRDAVQEKGYPPSVREIGQAVGMSSSSTVHVYLSRLEKLGFLRRDAAKPRAIELLQDFAIQTPKEETVTVPLVGRVTAGHPIAAIENIEDSYPLPRRWTGPDTTFLLTVQGDSMCNAGILDGDWVMVRKQSSAENGNIVVAMTEEEEATVKRFFREKNGWIRLQPENPRFEPLYLREAHILGLVTGLIRMGVS